MIFPSLHIIVFCSSSTHHHPSLSLLPLHRFSPHKWPPFYFGEILQIHFKQQYNELCSFYYVSSITRVRAGYSNTVTRVPLCMVYVVYAYACLCVCVGVCMYEVWACYGGQRLMSRVFLVTLHLLLLKQRPSLNLTLTGWWLVELQGSTPDSSSQTCTSMPGCWGLELRSTCLHSGQFAD